MTRRNAHSEPKSARTNTVTRHTSRARGLRAAPALRLVPSDGDLAMSPTPAVDQRVTDIRLLSRAARLMFSRQDPGRARALAMELARSTANMSSHDDPVRSWDPALQTDRGLGRARLLHRLVNSAAWQNDHGTSTPSATAEDSAADYLFAGVMNLVGRVPLSDEAHLFRLWYLATRAVKPPVNATRLFGDLRQLPVHQQLAAGARLMATVGREDEVRATGPSAKHQEP